MATDEQDGISRQVSSSHGGYEKAEGEQVPDDCVCGICHYVFNMPMVTPCRHTFCSCCILTWGSSQTTATLQNVVEQTPSTCPTCRSEFDVSQLISAAVNFAGLLNDIRIKCTFAGCEATVKHGDIIMHENRCPNNPERTVNCPGCQATVKHSDQHICEELMEIKHNNVKLKLQEVNNEVERQGQMLNAMLNSE